MISRLIRQEWQRLLLALQFLTRVPVHTAVFDAAELNRSARYFPAIGALVGSAGALVFAAAALLWPLPVAVLLSMAATVWLTGGFHEDGLADTCDGLGGAVSRERALAIMKDSRIGSYGALGLVLMLGLKAALLNAQGSIMRTACAMVVAHAVSRAAPVALLALLRYAGDAEHAKAKPMAQQVQGADVVIALLSALAVVALLATTLGIAPTLAALGAAALATAAMRRWLRRRLGGYTGDTLGATQQGVEAAVLLALAAAW
jgi:adenosylcobinamide-GDP ribazoletransferase